MTGLGRVLAALAGTAAAVLLVRWLVLAPYGVRSDSMRPTVRAGEVVLVDKVTHRVRGLHRGDLIVFRQLDEAVLKRVVALPGDTVAIRDAVLLLNGRPVREPYVDQRTVDGTYSPRVTVPPGSVFVLGDDRERSIDSRHYGPVRVGQVTGRVLAHW